MMEKIRDAVQQSAESASDRATAALRRSAYKSGWPGRAASSLRIKFDGKSWSVSGSDAAATLEYGDPDNVPNAAVRQFRNHSKVLESEFMSGLSSRLKGVL